MSALLGPLEPETHVVLDQWVIDGYQRARDAWADHQTIVDLTEQRDAYLVRCRKLEQVLALTSELHESSTAEAAQLLDGLDELITRLDALPDGPLSKAGILDALRLIADGD